MMKTARVHEYGGPEAIQIDELPRPEPPSGHVLVAVKAAGINFFDTQLRSGLYRRFSLPISLGLEGAGIVEGMIAKRRGATVIGTVSSEEKVPTAKAADADHVVVYTKAKLADEAKRLTNGRGVDVVYDAVGLETYEASLASLRPRGLLVLYGEASGLVPPIDVRSLLFQGSCALTRVGLEHFIETRSEFLRRANDILQWLANGTLRVHVDQTFALAEIAAAHRAIEDRKRVGKVLLRP